MDVYEIKDGRYLLLDEELGINFHGPFEGTAVQEHYPSGKIQSESYYLENALHGPSKFFSEEGILLSKSWFLFGLQQGKIWHFYASGKLYSVERFKHGLREGLQEYFYEDGTPKTVMHYEKGELHGEVRLYFPNGQIKREILFSHGIKQEHDQIGNEVGSCTS